MEDEVPAARPAFREQLIPQPAAARSPAPAAPPPPVFDGAELQKLFALPASLENPLDFDKTLRVAALAGRLVLVVITGDGDFESLKLARDVFSAEIVVDLIVENFVFWQRSSESPGGAEFRQLYKPLELPHLAVLDPRTGRSLRSWKARRFADGVSAASEIMDFLESKAARDFRRAVPLKSGEKGGEKAPAAAGRPAGAAGAAALKSPQKAPPGGARSAEAGHRPLPPPAAPPGVAGRGAADLGNIGPAGAVSASGGSRGRGAADAAGANAAGANSAAGAAGGDVGGLSPPPLPQFETVEEIYFSDDDCEACVFGDADEGGGSPPLAESGRCSATNCDSGGERAKSPRRGADGCPAGPGPAAADLASPSKKTRSAGEDPAPPVNNNYVQINAFLRDLQWQQRQRRGR